MSMQLHNNTPDNTPSIGSALATIIPGIGFITMLFMASNATFHNHLNDHIADRTHYWKVLEIQHDVTLDYLVYPARTAGHELIIKKDQNSIYKTKCTKIKAFCLGLQDNNITPIQLDFYARYQSDEPNAAFNQLLLKRVHYIDQTQKPQSLDRMTEAPNSGASLQRSKKSFTGFFVMFFVFYVIALLFVYALCRDENELIEKQKMYFFNGLAIALAVNYLYFIIRFLIQV